MNHLNAAMFVCFSFFNLHLHPGGLVNTMTKISLFMFRRKNSIFTILAENVFAVFEEKCVLTKKCSAFLWFWRKIHFLWVWRKIRFCGFGGKNTFCGFGGKSVFDEKVRFAGLTENFFFAILAEKMHFCGIGGKCAFLRF